jgi:hypothetical protein
VFRVVSSDAPNLWKVVVTNSTRTTKLGQGKLHSQKSLLFFRSVNKTVFHCPWTGNQQPFKFCPCNSTSRILIQYANPYAVEYSPTYRNVVRNQAMKMFDYAKEILGAAVVNARFRIGIFRDRWSSRN